MWPDMFYLVVFNLIGHHAFASANCPPDEYRVGIECCPSCPPGWLVEKDCAERSMTKCSRCPEGTFQPGRNKLKQCSTCTKCDAGLGLKVKKSCSSTSDAVCEVLDGFFCSDSNGGGCRAAQRHTVCSPGQYIALRGAADKDTECLPCADGTFSGGTSTSCQPHARCDSVGLDLMKPGTDSTDSECGEHTQADRQRSVSIVAEPVGQTVLELLRPWGCGTSCQRAAAEAVPDSGGGGGLSDGGHQGLVAADSPQ
ncbi:unnamed protein product [Boreogadus saida]